MERRGASRGPAAQEKLVQDPRSRVTSCGAPHAVAAGRATHSPLPAVAVALFLPAVALALLVPADVAAQQERYSSGQTLSPAYEGWERNDDGSFNLVPADFGDQELVWTVTVNGVTEKATLKRDYYIDKLVVQANFGAGGAAGTTPELPDNEPPTLEIEGAVERTVRAGEPLSLAAVSTDDGKPRARPLRYGARSGLPRPITTDSATGHRLSWFVYRGPGAGVMFDPPQIKV